MKICCSSFLRDLFSELMKQRLRYAVLRNAENLPDSLGGSDLDLLVANEIEAAQVEAAIRDVVARHGGAVTVCYKVEATVLCMAGREMDGTWWGVHVDLFPGFRYFGIPYVSTDDLFAEVALERDSFYRCGRVSDVASFLKELLHNGRTKKDYWPKARIAFRTDAESIKKATIVYWGIKGWKILEAALSREFSACELAVFARKLRWLLLCRQILSFHVLSFIRIKSNNLLRRLMRCIHAPGYCIAFLGTDGSGKGTLIEAITPFVELMLHSKVRYEHLRPNLLPSLAKLIGKRELSGPVTKPHGGKVAGRMSSLIRFFYYYFDYILGYWVKIFPILVKGASMVIFDRYYYEYEIDPQRCAVKIPKAFARFMGAFIPKPNVIFCLGGDPVRIFARKPETSLEEVQRQVRELKTFCEKDLRAVWIDTTDSIEVCSDKILTQLIERMSKR